MALTKRQRTQTPSVLFVLHPYCHQHQSPFVRREEINDSCTSGVLAGRFRERRLRRCFRVWDRRQRFRRRLGSMWEESVDDAVLQHGRLISQKQLRERRSC
ncbi:uncharacterized protein LOC142586408 [Dermacentor variabilis]|uniref:uncharacterized protein LOC142586408 n=1 Tax=Dermacentor variabilis TaxID=34621 RepID=UPI003F5C93E7